MVWCIALLPPEMKHHAHTHTHVRTYKYPDTQRIVEAVGILMIITAIITIMIQDASLLQIICYH